MCQRCARLGLECQAGVQRKVGRPAKRALANRKPNEQTSTHDANPQGEFVPDSVAGPSSESAGHTINFDHMPGLAQDQLSLDWFAPEFAPLDLQDFDQMALPVASLPQLQQSQQLHEQSNLQAPAATLTELSQTLSRLNNEIRNATDSIVNAEAGVRFESLFTKGCPGMTCVKVILRAAQEYLSTIKALHKMVGTKVTPSPEPPEPALSPRPPPPNFDHLFPSLAKSVCPEPCLDSSPTLQKTPEPPILDSHVAFLVVSCFAQLIRPLELIFTLITDRMSIGSVPDPLPGDMSFADVAIVEFTTQVLVFVEIVRHVLGQIQLVLGLPSTWSDKSMWTGLLSPPKYQYMLNKELGAVEGQWSARPARLMNLVDVAKDLLLEYSMVGFGE